MKEATVTIIIPTWNNTEYLRPCIISILRNQVTPGLMQILVINNGHPNSCDFLKGQKSVKVLNAPNNLGWEGGIDFGLRNSSSPFVVFMNDDTLVPQSSRLWINQMLQHFRNKEIGAVGPSSNVVMGGQNIFLDVPYMTFNSTFIIGFCAMMRRSAFEKIGGMDTELPGGDDLDWSIRLRKSGYKVMVDRSVFIFHHGFKTGERVEGKPTDPNGWNSYEKTSRTNTAIIKKHGLKEWWNTLSKQIIIGDVAKYNDDTEGKRIKKLITKNDSVILDLGCGPRKTLNRAIGIDFVKKGEAIPTLDESVKSTISQADYVADVSKDLPYAAETVDVIIARHIVEHMLDHITVLNYWIERLRKGGRLILALPNEEWHRTVPMNSEHVHAFTPQSTFVLLSSLGLKNIKLYDSGNNISFIAEGVRK